VFFLGLYAVTTVNTKDEPNLVSDVLYMVSACLTRAGIIAQLITSYWNSLSQTAQINRRDSFVNRHASVF
jgi:hypothetical protein